MMDAPPPLGKLVSGISLVAGVLVILTFLGIGLDALARLPRIPASPSNFLGLGLFSLGVALEGWATYILWKVGRGTPNPSAPPTRLVAEGPYLRSRNPLYLGRLSILLGAGLFAGSSGILAVALALLLGLEFVVIPREEKRLEERFGRAYLEYRTVVSRWLTIRRGRAPTSRRIER